MLKWGPAVGPMIYLSGVHSRAELANIILMICVSGVHSRAELVTHALVANFEWGQVGPRLGPSGAVVGPGLTSEGPTCGGRVGDSAAARAGAAWRIYNNMWCMAGRVNIKVRVRVREKSGLLTITGLG